MQDSKTQTVLILEGPDGVGKTTIGQALSKYIGLPYFRHGLDHDYWRAGKLKEFIEFSQPHYAELLRQTGLSLIADRAYPSERVYSDVYGRQTCDEVLKSVDEKFASVNATILLFLRYDYAGNKDDELVEHEKLRKLHDGYLKLKDWTRCNFITMYTDAYGNDLNRQLPLLANAIQLVYAKTYTPRGASVGTPVSVLLAGQEGKENDGR